MVRSTKPGGSEPVNLCSHCDDPHDRKECGGGCDLVDALTDMRRLDVEDA